MTVSSLENLQLILGGVPPKNALQIEILTGEACTSWDLRHMPQLQLLLYERILILQLRLTAKLPFEGEKSPLGSKIRLKTQNCKGEA